MVMLYGIRNCDTCRKALKWLESAGIEAGFHDFRRDGVPEARVQHWLQTLGAEQVISRRSPTWRKLGDADRARVDTAPVALVQEWPNLIRRPVLEDGGDVVVGFREAEYAERFGGGAA
ncbi:Spx/MgsR family RNA polymerase-binding regulatory protein [Aquisalimonas sp. 2447]|uniref:Spx/MgsR family RNA polymerase-binding regulatory protein n=1 Tax=Aquisalimonas sp. 2447 TaxID=2740807 RepID=UPI00143231A1|nr:Spx/MgsR family RNA polymerase-binding regulatory protein [Aquisalimonas sp. 2447]QIT55603.1 Spx/MgsR family RNA polymerase-binding regulatory protein [Aquisalimonas sp. 2447]